MISYSVTCGERGATHASRCFEAASELNNKKSEAKRGK